MTLETKALDAVEAYQEKGLTPEVHWQIEQYLPEAGYEKAPLTGDRHSYLRRVSDKETEILIINRELDTRRDFEHYVVTNDKAFDFQQGPTNPNPEEYVRAGAAGNIGILGTIGAVIAYATAGVVLPGIAIGALIGAAMARPIVQEPEPRAGYSLGVLLPGHIIGKFVYRKRQKRKLEIKTERGKLPDDVTCLKEALMIQ